jgi:hypothetical protein
MVEFSDRQFSDWEEVMSRVHQTSPQELTKRDEQMLALDRMDDPEINEWAMLNAPPIYDRFTRRMTRTEKLEMIFGLGDLADQLDPSWKQIIDDLKAKPVKDLTPEDLQMLDLDRMSDPEIDAYVLDYKPDLYDEVRALRDRESKLLRIFGILDCSGEKGQTLTNLLAEINQKPLGELEERDRRVMKLNKMDPVGITTWVMDNRWDIYDLFSRGMSKEEMIVLVYQNY